MEWIGYTYMINRNWSIFRSEPYAVALEDFISNVKPSTVLVGGNNRGAFTIAPRVAAHFRTGLTADCTKLDMQPNTDLDQIRPAFGGNIMAHIRTRNHRPAIRNRALQDLFGSAAVASSQMARSS